MQTNSRAVFAPFRPQAANRVYPAGPGGFSVRQGIPCELGDPRASLRGA